MIRTVMRRLAESVSNLFGKLCRAPPARKRNVRPAVWSGNVGATFRVYRDAQS